MQTHWKILHCITSYIPVFITTLHVKDIKILASFYAESTFKIIRGAIENMVIWKSAILRKQTNSFEGGISCSPFSWFSTVNLCVSVISLQQNPCQREKEIESIETCWNSFPLLQNTFLFFKLLQALSFSNRSRGYFNWKTTQNHRDSISEL